MKSFREFKDNLYDIKKLSKIYYFSLFKILQKIRVSFKTMEDLPNEQNKTKLRRKI